MRMWWRNRGLWPVGCGGEPAMCYKGRDPGPYWHESEETRLLTLLSIIATAMQPAIGLVRWLAAKLPHGRLTVQQVSEFNYGGGLRWALAVHNSSEVAVTDAVAMLDDIWFESMDTQMTLNRWERAVPMSWRGATDPARTSIASNAVMHVDLELHQPKSGKSALEIGYADPDVRSRETLSYDEPFLMQLSVAGAGQTTQFAVLRVDPPIARDLILRSLEPDRTPVELLQTGKKRAERHEFMK